MPAPTARPRATPRATWIAAILLVLGAAVAVAFVALAERGVPAPPGQAPPAGATPDDRAGSAGETVRSVPAATSVTPGTVVATTTSPHVLSGVVIDELEAPVSAFCVVQAPVATPRNEAAQQTGMPFADALGRFECRSAEPGPWSLLVRSEGFVPSWQSPVAGDQPVRVQLQRPALIHGRTLGPDGSPIGGIGIECLDARAPLTVAYRTASTPNGSYQLTPVHPGGYLVRVQGETNTRFAACRTGAPVRLDIDVPPATTVTCRIASAGKPLAGVAATLRVATADRVARTDAAGVATWLCVSHGYHQLTVSASGYEAQLHVIDTSNVGKTQFERTIELVPQVH